MIAPVIRSGRAADTAAVVALLHETFEGTWRPELTPAAITSYYGNRVAERFVAERVRTFLVADCGGEVAGMISRQRGFIDALHVGARFRRRGIGRALVEAAEAAMRADGVPRAALETDTFNRASQALYEGLGYRESSRYPDTEWNSGLTTIRYEKALE
jgi:ribosomal protein S18 acetylase RimI-like enzyme